MKHRTPFFIGAGHLKVFQLKENRVTGKLGKRLRTDERRQEYRFADAADGGLDCLQCHHIGKRRKPRRNLSIVYGRPSRARSKTFRPTPTVTHEPAPPAPLGERDSLLSRSAAVLCPMKCDDI